MSCPPDATSPSDAPAGAAGISACEGDFVIEAELAARQLGLPVEVFWAEVKRGIVFSVVERGEGEDAGRVRLTLRYRSKSWSVVRERVADRGDGAGLTGDSGGTSHAAS